MFKAVLVALVCCAALAAGNPAAGVEWRWKPRHVTVSPNIKALPFKKLVDTFVPEVRIPGTKIVANCGQTRAAQSRIVGGSEAVPHSYPWQVALFIDDGFFCGGSIINEDWILTAAHCMDGARIVEVVAGAHNIRLNEATQVSMTTTNFFVHENWGSILFKNDIALIRLPRSLSWTNAIAPICLPSYSDSDLPIGTWVNPSGWGKPSDSQSAISNVLREVTVPVMSNALCELVYGNLVSENVICIDSSGGRGPCNGDSGGPMNYVKLGKTYNRGIVSFGSTTGCETGYPDAFTRTKNYLAWISRNTGIYIDP